MTTTRPASRAGIYGQGIVAGVLVAVWPGVAVLLAILLAPVIAHVLINRGMGQQTTRPMTLLSAATAMMPVRELWNAGLGINAALDLCQPATVALSWAAAAAAWLIVETSSIVCDQVSQAVRNRTRAALQAERAALELEWAGLGD